MTKTARFFEMKRHGRPIAVLTAYDDYRAAIADLARAYADRLDISLSAYGHLSPRGIDPHHRVTIIAPMGGEAALAEARIAVAAAKKELIRDLLRASENHACVVTGGEKGLPSVVEIMRVAGGDNRAPDDLRRLARVARAAVAAAPRAFTFRAPSELNG